MMPFLKRKWLSPVPYCIFTEIISISAKDVYSFPFALHTDKMLLTLRVDKCLESANIITLVISSY